MIIDPNRFGKDYNKSGISFGFGRTEAAGELRKLADAVEDGRALVQDIQYSADCKLDEYLMHKLVIVYAEMDKEIREKTLYGPECKFPVDVQKV